MIEFDTLIFFVRISAYFQYNFIVHGKGIEFLA